jgi:hypothetical protein
MNTTETESIRHQANIAGLPIVEGRATAQTAQTLRDELLYQRATQTYLWALPLINTLGMQRGSEQTFGAGYNVLPVWKNRLDARTLVTTPNSDVIYAMSYVDLGKDGPLVFDAPPMLQGILLDFWQRPIPVDGGKFAGDFGFFGPDQGQGGKFLLLPPGYEGEVPKGYFVCRSGTNNVFMFFRAFYADASNLKPPVELIEKTKIYPLKGEAKPMQFPNASGVPANMLPISDATAFDQLKKLVDAEGPHLAEPDWMGMLAGLGIVRGEPFAPDERTRGILDRAAKSAYKMSRVIAFDEVLSGRSFRMYPDRRWVNPMADATPAKPSGNLGAVGPRRGPRSRRPPLDVHQLLLDQPRHALADSRQGSVLRHRLHRQRWRALDRRDQLQAELSKGRAGCELLVLDAVRGRKRLGPCQRTALPLARIARLAGPERRRQH